MPRWPPVRTHHLIDFQEPSLQRLKAKPRLRLVLFLRPEAAMQMATREIIGCGDVLDCCYAELFSEELLSQSLKACAMDCTV
jgi:hypothetical protein